MSPALGPLLAAAVAGAAPSGAVPPSPGGFVQDLMARAPDPAIPASAHVYDRLIGDWDVEFRDTLADGRKFVSHGTWRFAWVLEGKLLQDVIVTPADALPADVPRRIGMTLRTYDPKLDAWRVIFIVPGAGVRNELIGRLDGETIVQTGLEKGVRPIRWSFVRFTADSCVWLGESLADDGKTWTLESEFRLRRIGAPRG